MTDFTLSVSTDSLGLGVIDGARVVVDRLRATASEQYPPIDVLYRIEQSTDEDGLCDFQLKFDDISTYHRARVFSLDGVPVYNKVFLMPAEAISLQDADSEPPSDVLLSRRVYAISEVIGLRSLTSDVGNHVYAASYSDASFPHGGGMFHWDSESVADDDGGSVFQVNDVATGRWIRSGMPKADVRWFGAIGNGLTNDTQAMVAAFEYAIANGVSMYIPSGCFLVNSKAMSKLDMPAGSRFVMFGDGMDSIIRVNDNQVVSDYSTVFRFGTDGAVAVDRIEVRDVFIDHNATGSATPSPSTAYQHSHTFFIAIDSGGTCNDVRFINVVVSDPPADVFNNSGLGGVKRYSVDNCSVENRTRSRSDIQFSRAPETAVISGFIGSRIESELDGSQPYSESSISISNSVVSILELSSRTDHSASYLLSNVKTTGRVIIESGFVSASGCDFALGVYGEITKFQRFNLLLPGSKFSNTRFLLNYTTGTSEVAGLYLYNTTRDSSVGFSNCRFEIDYAGPLPSDPVGYAIFSNYDTFNPSTYMNSITVDSCWFDPRLYGSVDTSANSPSNEWILRDNTYGGISSAIKLGSNASSLTRVVIDGGDFSGVTGNGFYLSASSSSASTINFSGVHIGAKALVIDGDVFAMSNMLYAGSRTVLSPNTPGEGFPGDKWIHPSPVIGGGLSYVCVSGSYLGAATWRLVEQYGIKKDSSVNRPAVNSMDVGLLFLDTTLDANGKLIHYNGSSWVT